MKLGADVSQLQRCERVRSGRQNFTMAVRALLILGCLLVLLPHGAALVYTEAQPGPLYRVVGSPLSISCTTSGFKDVSATKVFEFRVRKPDFPTFDHNIIKTGDPTFSYSSYMRRMEQQEISLTHSSPNSVVFLIKHLQKEDEGEYECTVVNSEILYAGTYSAKTSVKVIDDLLSVAAPAAALSYRQGEELTLTCQASSNTVQHTHLSLTWLLHRDHEENPEPIMTLDRDFTLTPGVGFQSRYQAGLLRLDKEGGALYRLGVARLEPSDQGRIYCQAQEWIQDPDLSWYSIAQRDTEGSRVNVTARALEPDSPSLEVRLTAEHTSLQEGQPLQLSCSVDSPNLEEKLVGVAWLQGAVVLAEIGPRGIQSVPRESRSRGRDGSLRASRVSVTDYHLVLASVRTEDQGEYRCRAWISPTDPKDSEPLRVTVDATESDLSVQLPPAVVVNEADRLKLTCKVQGAKGQLSVTWRRQVPAPTTGDIISLSEEGVTEKAPDFEDRVVIASRPASDVFVLELDAVKPADSGDYICAVSERTTGASQSQKAAVTVRPTGSLVRVNLKSRQHVVTVGDSVELMCFVSGPQQALAVTWILQRGATVYDILRLHPDGTISWSAEQHRYQLKVQNQGSRRIYHLLVNRASLREAGTYQCQVSMYQENVYQKLNTSNSVTIGVEIPESRLVVTSAPDLIANVNSDVDLKCSVTSVTTPAARLAVRWILQQTSGTVSVLSWDQDSVTSNSSPRISMRRGEGPSFHLTLRRVASSDVGQYRCEVVEWLQDPRGEWFRLTPASTLTNLTLTEPANDLGVTPTQQKVDAEEGEEVELTCVLVSNASRSSIFYKVSWFYMAADPPRRVQLVELDHTGLLRVPDDLQLRNLQGRLQLLRPTEETFSLKIQQVHVRDSGRFWCDAERYQLDPESGWEKMAAATAGPIAVNITAAHLESGCKTGLWVSVLVCIILVLVLVLALLLGRVCRTKSEQKKKQDSLWTEQQVLKESHD